jgi:hypothetical protein
MEAMKDATELSLYSKSVERTRYDGSVQLVREMMEHQDSATQPIRSDVERRPEERERVLTHGPCAYFLRARHGGVMLAIVEHHLE